MVQKHSEPGAPDLAGNEVNLPSRPDVSCLLRGPTSRIDKVNKTGLFLFR